MHVTNWGKYYPQNFGGMDSLYKSHIFLPDDEFLHYSMPEVFNETGHGFIDRTVYTYTEYYIGTEGSLSTVVASSVKILFIS